MRTLAIYAEGRVGAGSVGIRAAPLTLLLPSAFPLDMTKALAFKATPWSWYI